jgi:hypothetical protein
MTNEPALASAIGSPVLAVIRSQVPEFEETFQRELDAEGPEMGAFQAMSEFARWLEDRMEAASPGEADVQRAFRVVEEVASSNYVLGRALVTEFVRSYEETRGPSN